MRKKETPDHAERDTLRPNLRKPSWLKVSIPGGENFTRIQRALDKRGLHTICRSARCPNIGECWNHGHATFLIMGPACTRNCRFCAVPHDDPSPLDAREPEKLVETAAIMKLKYAVITSVTRDDLPDGGSRHFAQVISTLKTRIPHLMVEVLIPDFGGSRASLYEVLDAAPHVLNHNIETVENLYPLVGRPPERFQRSIMLLSRASERGAITKSGIMVGLGETREQLERLFARLREAGVSLLTIGQYCRPSPGALPVKRYYSPEEFDSLKQCALSAGFTAVASGPLVRSSYHARDLYAHYQKARGIQS